MPFRSGQTVDGQTFEAGSIVMRRYRDGKWQFRIATPEECKSAREEDIW